MFAQTFEPGLKFLVGRRLSDSGTTVGHAAISALAEQACAHCAVATLGIHIISEVICDRLCEKWLERRE